nr:hypothetical protein [Tanacetum cinerariifolium]
MSASLQNRGNLGQTTKPQNMDNGRGKPCHNTLIHYYNKNKHGLPSKKRLFRVTQLDPIPALIGPWGRFRDPRQPFL